MLKITAFLLVILLLGGCAASLQPPPADLTLLPNGATLWKLSLAKRDKPLYAGILLLNHGADGATGLALLDGTGIKLFEGRVTAAGDLVEVKALRAVADRGLPDFLGRAVARLFLLAPPPGRTCRPETLGELCFGVEEGGRLVKVRRWGGLGLWKADYAVNNEGLAPQTTGARLQGGWLSPEVKLEKRLEPPE